MPGQASRLGAEVRQCKYRPTYSFIGPPNIQTISTVYSCMLSHVARVIHDF